MLSMRTGFLTFVGIVIGTIMDSRVLLPFSFFAALKASSGTVTVTNSEETSSFSPGVKSHLTLRVEVSRPAPRMRMMFVNSAGGISLSLTVPDLRSLSLTAVQLSVPVMQSVSPLSRSYVPRSSSRLAFSSSFASGTLSVCRSVLESSTVIVW